MLKNIYWQSNTLLYFKRANKYFPIIEEILAKNNIPDDFKYLADPEYLELIRGPTEWTIFHKKYRFFWNDVYKPYCISRF